MLPYIINYYQNIVKYSNYYFTILIISTNHAKIYKGDQMKFVEIYTDGACSGNPGKGGWGAVLVHKGREK